MTYDRTDAREHARNLLATRLAAVRGELRSHEARRREEAELFAEIEALEREAADRVARAPARLPTGATVSVASPCKERWEGMVGDERVRHCSRCDKNVYNLSALSGDEITRLVERREGEMCVRFFKRADGTMITSDCPVGRPTKIALRVLTAAGLALGAGVAGVAAAEVFPRSGSCPTTTVESPEIAMGAAVYVAPVVRTPPNQAPTPPPPQFERREVHEVAGGLALRRD